jgi:hypothetical protein
MYLLWVRHIIYQILSFLHSFGALLYFYSEFLVRPEVEEAAQPEDRTDTPEHHETD